MSLRSNSETLRVAFITASFGFLAGCASQQGDVPVMPMGQVAPPPPGFFDFCRRSPQACDVVAKPPPRAPDIVAGEQQAAARAKVDQRYWAAVLASLRSRSGSSTAWTVAEAAFEGRSAEVSGGSTAAAPGEAVRSGPAEPLSAPKPSLDVVSWTPATQRLVNSINRNVNAAILARPAAYELATVDYWSAPTLVGADRYGDCKDYALKKREALIDAGVPAGALSLAVVRTPGNELHAVLLIATDRGELVLDNRSAWIVAWNQTGYRWEMRQVAGDPFLWVSVAPRTAVTLASASALAAPSAAGVATPASADTLLLARNDAALP